MLLDVVLLTLFLFPSSIYAKSFATLRAKKTEEQPSSPLTLKAPSGWECINDATQLPAKVKLLYIGKGKGAFAPSINLASEETIMSPQEYVELAKKYHESQSETTCRLLGDIETKLGKACLLQIDRKTGWGNIRFLQASFVKEGIAYVITATATQEEFASLYPQFYHAIQSFKN